MGDTSIQWTQKSWNPIAAYYNEQRGWMCSKPSAGCKNCYSEALNLRLGNGLRYTPENVSKIEWRLVNLDEPLSWRTPQICFVESMGDFFHEALPEEMIGRIWSKMLECPQHVFQVLTKRVERMREIVSRLNQEGKQKGLREPEHIWLGVSVENQEEADHRIPELLQTPARVRFLSCEPLLDPLDLQKPGPWSTWLSPCGYYCDHDEFGGGHRPERGIDWVIIGGESGRGARPFHLAHARNLIAQCQAAGVPA